MLCQWVIIRSMFGADKISVYKLDIQNIKKCFLDEWICSLPEITKQLNTSKSTYCHAFFQQASLQPYSHNPHLVPIFDHEIYINVTSRVFSTYFVFFCVVGFILMLFKYIWIFWFTRFRSWFWIPWRLKTWPSVHLRTVKEINYTKIRYSISYNTVLGNTAARWPYDSVTCPDLNVESQ